MVTISDAEACPQAKVVLPRVEDRCISAGSSKLQHLDFLIGKVRALRRAKIQEDIDRLLDKRTNALNFINLDDYPPVLQFKEPITMTNKDIEPANADLIQELDDSTEIGPNALELQQYLLKEKGLEDHKVEPFVYIDTCDPEEESISIHTMYTLSPTYQVRSMDLGALYQFHYPTNHIIENRYPYDLVVMCWSPQLPEFGRGSSAISPQYAPPNAKIYLPQTDFILVCKKPSIPSDSSTILASPDEKPGVVLIKSRTPLVLSVS